MVALLLQALFAKLQQLATVAGDVLLGKEKIQKILLARLTETVLMWLSDEQEFWSVFENDTCPLQPLGLQQVLISFQTVCDSGKVIIVSRFKPFNWNSCFYLSYTG